MKLQSFTLQIFEPKKTLNFYTTVLGFRLLNKFSENNSIYYNLGFQNQIYFIQLKYTPDLSLTPYQEMALDNYWKYSIFVTDIQKTYQGIQQRGYRIGDPYQFGDIGYLSHTTDNENHNIEFIQKTFKSNPLHTQESNPSLGLLTIRTKDPVKIVKFYEEVMGLKLYVRMYVDRGRGFTLYFLGHKNLKVPSIDIDAIENREWMYQQSHLFIEIQHYWNSENNPDFYLNASDKNGLRTINFSGNLEILKKRLIANNIVYNEINDEIIFQNIDHHKISVKTAYDNDYN